jgi:hypothetical protein
LATFELFIATAEPDVSIYENVGLGLSVVGGVILYELSAKDTVIGGKFARFGDFFRTVILCETVFRVNEPLGSCVTEIVTVPPARIVAVVPAMEIILVLSLENENAPSLFVVGGVNVKGVSP